MKIDCVWEHNGGDSLLYAENVVGAFTRGASKEEALLTMPEEIRRFLLWRGDTPPDSYDIEIVQEKSSDLQIRDADSDVLRSRPAHGGGDVSAYEKRKRVLFLRDRS